MLSGVRFTGGSYHEMYCYYCKITCKRCLLLVVVLDYGYCENSIYIFILNALLLLGLSV